MQIISLIEVNKKRNTPLLLVISLRKLNAVRSEATS